MCVRRSGTTREPGEVTRFGLRPPEKRKAALKDKRAAQTFELSKEGRESSA